MIYGMPIVVANRVGLEGGLHFWGGSRILGPKGDILVMSETPEETLLEVELDYKELRDARFRLPTVRDSNLDLIRRETERLAQTVGVPSSVRDPL
jgi:predicted amidohydrolase